MPSDTSRALRAFADAHPWSGPSAPEVEPVEALWQFRIAAAPEQVWPYVIETSRLNRALGLGRMAFEEVGGRLRGRTRYFGVTQEWEEVPWDWNAARSMTSVRRYRRGLASVSRGIYELEAADGGCLLRVYFGFVPRGRLARLALRAGLGWLGRRYRAAVVAIDANLGADLRAIEGFRVEAPPLDDDHRARLDGVRANLARTPASPAACEALIHHVLHGDELELYRIQVRPLARDRGLDERELVEACLHATRAGLLELSWDVICPHCRGVRQQARSLGDLPARDSCDACEIEFSTGSEHAVEITFNVHPSIREVPRVYYCSAEPSTKLHIKLKQRLAPGETRRVATRLDAGRYRLRVEGEMRYRYLELRPGAASELRWRAADAAAAADDALVAAPSPQLELVAGERGAVFVIEDTQWSDDALRPAQLFNLQAFRDLFSEEYLASDLQLEVGEQTILFTDIVGSTRFYGERGDPHAFMEVRRHFVELYEEVARHHGAVVKTIGDAAMAAFANPVDGLQAAVAIQRRFPDERDDSEVRLRASLNTGPCIAVNLNSGIDYFGLTVNLASKLQTCAGPGEIAVARAVLDLPGVKDALRALGAALRPSRLEHAAFTEPIEVVVWRVDDQAVARAATPGVAR